jgi:hypothetical protein
MNATVCADMDHGQGGGHKIAGSNKEAGRRDGMEGAMTRGDGKQGSLAEALVLRGDDPTVLRGTCPLEPQMSRASEFDRFWPICRFRSSNLSHRGHSLVTQLPLSGQLTCLILTARS